MLCVYTRLQHKYSHCFMVHLGAVLNRATSHVFYDIETKHCTTQYTPSELTYVKGTKCKGDSVFFLFPYVFRNCQKSPHQYCSDTQEVGTRETFDGGSEGVEAVRENYITKIIKRM